MENKNNPKEIQVELNDQIAEGIYSNLVIVSHSDAEFIFDFARLLPGKPKARIHSRIIMNPKNAKLFLKAFQENINKYEKNFGKIKDGNLDPSKLDIQVDDNTVN